MTDDDLRVRPGRSRARGARSFRKAQSLVGRVLQISRRSGYSPLTPGRKRRGTGHRGRGRSVALQQRRSRFDRRVVVKARVVRQQGTKFSSAPLARHVAYLEREGVTRDGTCGQMFDDRSDAADGEVFAERCSEDRHHFRFIVSPEDAAEMADLRDFTRELMADMARDLDTRLDWVALDHWNTDNPHVHVLVRGIADNGEDLVIDRSYVSEGLRGRAEQRVTLELGPRSERDIEATLAREVAAERWTTLDRQLARLRDADGVIDLRPQRAKGEFRDRHLLIGRAQELERLGLAERIDAASWTLSVDAEPVLRALGDRGDIIRTMHRAISGQSWASDEAVPLELHEASESARTIGRLVERGLHDELTGEAYAIIEGVDGRTHYRRFATLERTGDAAPGAIVETSSWRDRKDRAQTGLLVRSDLSIERQIDAKGATWLDRQLVSPRPEPLAGAFGEALAGALDRRTKVLLERGLAQPGSGGVRFIDGLLDHLRASELAEARAALEVKYGPPAPIPSTGEAIAGVYRERVTLASGRFAMIDDGMGFQLVPWRQDLDRRLGEWIGGTMTERGGVDWSFARTRGPAL